MARVVEVATQTVVASLSATGACHNILVMAPVLFVVGDVPAVPENPVAADFDDFY